MSWKRADVVILTAIELEYAAVQQVEAGAAPGSRWAEETHEGLPVAMRELLGRGGRRLRVVVARAPGMGKGSAVSTLLPLVDALRPSCIAMCGVCAGQPGKTALGDVVAGERLYDYDAGKWQGGEFQADVRTYSLPAPWKIALERFDPKARFGAAPDPVRVARELGAGQAARGRREAAGAPRGRGALPAVGHGAPAPAGDPVPSPPSGREQTASAPPDASTNARPGASTNARPDASTTRAPRAPRAPRAMTIARAITLRSTIVSGG